ncbi:MAG: hypothetical protein AB7F09_18075 [Parvibaculaceae bacterium]
MSDLLRKLNDEGILRFRGFIAGGANGNVPIELLSNPETSEPLPTAIVPDGRTFETRYDFGSYLNQIFVSLNAASISHDQGFWSGAALFWFDHICPTNSTGVRKPDKDYRYILSRDYRHYYRHAVRSPWQLVRAHGELAKLLLVSPKEQQHPLGVHGEILEQLGGRQQILGSRPIMAAANRLYYDQTSGRPRTGVAGSGKGSARRFGLVLRQLDLTYDPEGMPEDDLIGLLPTEFDRWKPKKMAQTGQASQQETLSTHIA